MQNIILDPILDLVRKVGRQSQLDPRLLEELAPTTSFSKELAMDSLAQMELLNQVEREFGVTLEPQSFTSIDNCLQLASAIAAAPRNKPYVSKEKAPGREAYSLKTEPHGKTLLEALHWRANQTPERAHIRFYSDEGQDNFISYGELWKSSAQTARALRSLGVEDGDRVALMLPTGPDYFRCFIGALMTGAVPVPVYPPAKKTQLKEHVQRHLKIFKNCQAKALVASQSVKLLSAGFQRKAPAMKIVVTPETLNRYPKKEERGESRFKPRQGAADDPALIQYTSGSTGDPKGVLLTNRNLLENIKAMGQSLRVTSNDIVASWLPLYHDMGLIGTWLSSLYYGATLVLMPPEQFLLRPQRWLWAIHRYGATICASPNFGYELCLKKVTDADLEGLDLSTLRAALNGAEPVSPETIRNFTNRFAPFAFKSNVFMPVYGLAENAVGLCFPPLGREPLITRLKRAPFMKSGLAIKAETHGNTRDIRMFIELPSCGSPISRNEIRIIGRDGKELSEGHVGEIEFRGPSTTPGYYNSPEKTRELFHDGWARSGDLGFVHQGEVYISGRIKDMIIKAGRNIFPQELEEAVGLLEGVRKGRVAVFSSPALEGEEKLIIAAELRPNFLNKEGTQKKIVQEIRALSQKLLETPADEVLLVPARTILKTSSGKIRRSAIKEAYMKGKLGSSQRKSLFWLASFMATSHIYRIRKTAASIAFKFFRLAYGIWFYLVLGLIVPPVALWARFAPWGLKHQGIAFGVRAFLFTTFIKMDIKGVENLPPKNRPAIFVANHRSYMDAPLLVAFLNRPIVFTAKAELAENPFYKFLLEPLSTIFIKRSDHVQALEQLEKAEAIYSRRRLSLVFFPEAFMRIEDELSKFRMGAFTLASRLNSPVVPLTIKGSDRVLSLKNFWPRPPLRLRLHILPCELPVKSEDDEWDKAVKLRNQIQKEMARDLWPGRAGPKNGEVSP